MKQNINEIKRIQQLAGITKLYELETPDVSIQGDNEDVMLKFIKAVEKAPNAEEIFEKFENFINSFMPGAIKEFKK